MKIRLFAVIFGCLFFAAGLSAQVDTAETAAQDVPEKKEAPSMELKLGKFFFPLAFVHNQKEYAKGTYRVELTWKEDIPYFLLRDQKNELLFEEMAIVVPWAGNKAKGYRMSRGVLKGNEYFRIKVIRNDQVILGYFLLKTVQAESTTPPEPEKDK